MDEFYYIQNGDIVITDYELTEDKYILGKTIEDYTNGAYIRLDETQIDYYKKRPSASPEEIFFKKELNYTVSVITPELKALNYMENNIHCVYINGEKLKVLNWKELLELVKLYEQDGKDEVILEIEARYFKTSVKYAKQMLVNIGIFETLINIVAHRHITYLEFHAKDKDSYDYTSGYPKIPEYTLEEIDVNPTEEPAVENSEILSYELSQETQKYNETKQFQLDGTTMWIDSEERGNLRTLTLLKQSKGETTIQFWKDKCYNISCEAFLRLLDSLEEYSAECFIIYQRRKELIKNNVGTIVSPELAETIDYPEIIKFNSFE